MTTQTVIAFAVPREGPADLSVYDVTGRWVRTLASGVTGAGEHRVTWDGHDSYGRRVAPGIYLCRLVTPDARYSRKMAVVD